MIVRHGMINMADIMKMSFEKIHAFFSVLPCSLSEAYKKNVYFDDGVTKCKLSHAYLTKIMKEFEGMGLIKTEIVGRNRMINLTEDGKKIRDSLHNIVVVIRENKW